MSERAKPAAPAETIHEVVKTYIRLNRARLAADGELMALLLPERFEGDVLDLQKLVIARLQTENAALKAKLGAVERAVLAWRNALKS